MSNSNAITAYAKDALKIFGSAIKTHRIDKNISQANLAERIRSSRKTVAAIESGSPTVAIGKVFEAAAIVGLVLFDADERLIGKMAAQERRLEPLLPKSISKTNTNKKVDNDF